MERIDYDHDIDTVNVEMFNRTGTAYPAEKRYRCVLCKNPVCIDDSFSKQGHKLICYTCLYAKFKGIHIHALEWQGGDSE